jgi:hypothetical protein
MRPKEFIRPCLENIKHKNYVICRKMSGAGHKHVKHNNPNIE